MNMKQLLEIGFSGDKAAMANQFGVSERTVLRWANGETKPQREIEKKIDEYIRRQSLSLNEKNGVSEPGGSYKKLKYCPK